MNGSLCGRALQQSSPNSLCVRFVQGGGGSISPLQQRLRRRRPRPPRRWCPPGGWTARHRQGCHRAASWRRSPCRRSHSAPVVHSVSLLGKTKHHAIVMVGSVVPGTASTDQPPHPQPRFEGELESYLLLIQADEVAVCSISCCSGRQLRLGTLSGLGSRRLCRCYSLPQAELLLMLMLVHRLAGWQAGCCRMLGCHCGCCCRRPCGRCIRGRGRFQLRAAGD